MAVAGDHGFNSQQLPVSLSAISPHNIKQVFILDIVIPSPQFMMQNVPSYIYMYDVRTNNKHSDTCM